MVGGGDDDGVDVLAVLVEHLAEVFVTGGLGIALVGGGGAAVVNVAKGDDILGGGGGAKVGCALPSGADGGEVQLLIRRLVAGHSERSRTAEAC